MNLYHRWACSSGRWKQALERRVLPWALGSADLGDDLLEVGPGPGLTTDALRTRVARVTCVEIDARLAAALGRRLAGTNVRVVRGDAAALPLAGGSFSSAVCLTMLHHVPSPALQDRLLAEVCRVLRPGGRLFGFDAVWGLALWLVHLGDTLVTVDPDTFGARLEAAGFREVVIDRQQRAFRFRATRPG
jgi:SAM-dependent methyltransferase